MGWDIWAINIANVTMETMACSLLGSKNYLKALMA
jgi:hypothetical protein